MDLSEAIVSRRAVRAYKPDAVDDKVIRALIDAAIQAPSAMNEQPWSFTVVRDKALLDRISQDAKAHMLRTTPAGLLSHHGGMLADKTFHIFYHAPVLIVISSRSDGPWAAIDCALAAQNLMLAARGRGLGSCWIGFAQSWLGTPDGKAALNLPAAYVPVAPIIVGHPVSFPPAVARKPAEIAWIAP
ncbi:MAG TPA: nitroreductase [Pseudolabrys sp.]|nr:nitroreductase [Pseudolabrys sp.]